MSKWLKKFQEMPNQPTDNLDTVSTASRLSASQPTVFEKVDWNEQPDPAIAAHIAQTHDLTVADLQQAAGLDWAEIENDAATLEASANSIQIRRMRERGEIPAHYTAITICRHCGPVPIFPGVAERVAECVWCFRRMQGLSIPRLRKAG